MQSVSSLLPQNYVRSLSSNPAQLSGKGATGWRHLVLSRGAQVFSSRSPNPYSRNRTQHIRQGTATQAKLATQQEVHPLHSPYQLLDTQIHSYRDAGFVRLSNVFDAATLAHYTPTMSLEVSKADKTPLEDDSDYQKAFTQVLLCVPI